MNKKQLISAISEQAQLTADQADAAFNATFDCITQIMVDSDSINIAGFGSFGSKLRAARKGRNPSTGEEIQIAQAMVPYFKAGVKLKETVNQKALIDTDS